ncbi:MAG: SpoVA/SpoVAEb family sporulation membrane protein, partial [Oscillospiraceae bacterium]|nr:SpoVA/SpoVAEb family sporulation membrane protein [Oscillospiraceae bacterium]
MLLRLLIAFLVGGALCIPAQVLIDKTNYTPAKILTAYVVAGVLLGAVGLYKPLVTFAGAGASVPLLGFGNALVEGVRKAVDERGLIGALSGGITSTAAGVGAAIFFSTIAGLIVR